METTVLIQSAPKPDAAFPPSQWCYTYNLIKIGQLTSEIFKFESVDDDGRRRTTDDDGRTDDGPLVYYKLTLWAFGSGELIKGCRSKTHFISSIFRLLCPALWHYVREHIIYTVYSDCVLVFAFAFLTCKKTTTKNPTLNRTFSTESYRNWRKSINISKNKGLFLKNKQKF